MAGLFVESVGADVADVRIGQTDNLPRVTGVGKNFLVTSERGIENDLASAARSRAGGAALKYAPVLEREYSFCGWRDQSCFLRKSF